MAAAALTAILTAPITQKALAPALEGAQADADLTAGVDQARTSGMGLVDQLNRLLALGGTSQPSASSEQKASHFFRSTSKAAISAMAFSLRCSSFLRALISFWSWARSFSSSFCSYGSASSPDCVYKVSTGFSLASSASGMLAVGQAGAAWRQRSTCSGYSPRSRQ